MKTPPKPLCILKLSKVLLLFITLLAIHERTTGNTVSTLPQIFKKPQPDAGNITLVDLPVKAKIDTVLACVKTLHERISNEEFFRIRDKCEPLFSASGYINLEIADGRILRLTRSEFLLRARESRSDYELKKSTLLLNDRFRKGPSDRWFCRSTTFHEVSRFDRNSPIPEKVTLVQSKPMLQKAPTLHSSYWQIIELTFKEI